MNKQLFNIIIISILILTISLGFLSCGEEKDAKDEDTILTEEEEEQFTDMSLDIKVGVIYGGYGTFAQGPNEMAHQGIIKAQEVFDFQLTEREITEDIAMDVALTQLAEENDLIIGVGMDVARSIYSDVGRKFPDKTFVVIGRRSQFYDKDNVASMLFRENEAAYLAGIIAAQKSQSGKIVYIASFPTDSTERYKIGFSRGAKRVNPDIHIITRTGSPEDNPSSIRTSLVGYFDMGFDVIFLTANEWRQTVLELASEYDAKVITENGYFYEEAPDTIISSISRGYDAMMFEIMRLKAKDALDTDRPIYVGIRKGFDYIIPPEEGEGLSENMMKTLHDVKIDLANGEINFPELKALDPLNRR